MKRFYYQLKCKEKGIYEDYWGKAILKGIVTAENSKCAREIIKKEVFERDFKKGDDVLLTVLEITPNRQYLEDFFKPQVCKYCGRTWIQAHNEYYGDFCCKACYEQYEYDRRIKEGELFISEDWHEAHPVIYRIYDRKNNKNYIGQTIRPFTLRWWEHYKSWIQRVENAIITDFEFMVIEILPKNIDKNALSRREQYYIEKYNALKDGYNSRNEIIEDEK